MNQKLVSIIITTYNRAKDTGLCLNSIFRSDYEIYEVVVVDNASTDDTVELLEKKYGKKITLIKSEKNLMASGGRNLGAQYAKGEYLLFIDSDNIIDKSMISKLIEGIESLADAGLVGPLMYYRKEPKKVWWAGAEINLWTSKTNYIGIGEIDDGQYNKIKKVGHIPNIFMIQKVVWDGVDGIDGNFGIHYEESDLAEKIRKKGYNTYLVPYAKAWHNIPLSNESIRQYGGESIERAYYMARNRIFFMRKNAPKINFLFFILIFNNVFLAAYIFIFLKNKKWNLAKAYLKGAVDAILNK